MKQVVIGTALGLSIIASSIAATAPASATALVNYAKQNLCLGTAGGRATPGTPLIVFQCDGSSNQNWLEQFIGLNPYSQFSNGLTYGSYRMCLAAANGGTNDGTKLILWYCDRTYSQEWEPVASGYYYQNDPNKPCFWLENGNDASKVMSVPGGNNLQAGTQAILYSNFWDVQRHKDQLWCRTSMF